jgi:plasmid stability protein
MITNEPRVTEAAKPVTCRLDVETTEWLKVSAKKNHRSVSQEIRFQLTRAMEDHAQTTKAARK